MVNPGTTKRSNPTPGSPGQPAKKKSTKAPVSPRQKRFTKRNALLQESEGAQHEARGKGKDGMNKKKKVTVRLL